VKITLTHSCVKTIEIDVKSATKDNLKKYAKELQKYTKGNSIYPWYIVGNFTLMHTDSWFVNEDNQEVLDKLDSEFGFIQNAINCYYGTHEKIKENV